MERYTAMNRNLWTKSLSYDEYVGKTFDLYVILNILHVSLALFLTEFILENITIFLVTICFWLYMIFRSHYMCKVMRKAAFLYIIFGVVFLIGILMGTGTFGNLLVRFLWLYGLGIPMYGLFVNVIEPRVVMKNSRKCIPVSAMIGILTIIIGKVGGGIKGDYSMALGYALLYPILLLIMDVKDKKSVSSLVMLAINAIVIVSFGSRGQILCIGVFVIMWVSFGERRITPKRVTLVSLLLITGCLIYFNLKSILTWMIDFLALWGIHSRSLGYFLERLHYTGREVVWEAAICNIKAKPIWGWTVNVDTSAAGFYPHNLFLELLLHYGCIIGGAIAIFLVIELVRNILIDKHNDTLLLIMFSYGFIPLMLSSEYLVWPSFWAFLALCMRRKKKSIGRKIEDENSRCYNDL